MAVSDKEILIKPRVNIKELTSVFSRPFSEPVTIRPKSWSPNERTARMLLGDAKNNNDDHDSNGVDSGQGSSLDRDYSSYNGQYSRGGVWAGGQSQTSQYYYNLPQTGAQARDRDQARDQEANNNSPRRRAPGDTLDIANREYRGSAFELYKKPGYSIPSSYQQ